MEPLDTPSVLDRLRDLIEASTTTADNRATATQWYEDIRAIQDFLERRDHSIVFIGTVGVGKSSLIGTLAGLLLGEVTDRSSLKDNSILSIGSGRTTVCEVRIEATPLDRVGQIGLVVEPVSEEEMRQEIEDYARREWERRHPGEHPEPRHGAFETAQEIHRFIRTMTGYAERQEVVLEGGLKRRRNIRPLDDVIPRFDTLDDFTTHLVDRASLPTRAKDETSWWWPDGPQARRELKRCFEAVNQGSEPTTWLPRRMTVVIPEPLPQGTGDFAPSLVDTRGLDGSVESRRDLQEFLEDPRAVIVLCAPFMDAPGETMRMLLQTVASDARLRPAIERSLLVLVDQGDADQVNGADGVREFGQDIKVDECHRALEWAGLSPSLAKEQLIAFDAIKDDRQRLLGAVERGLSALRARREALLHEQMQDARSFLSSVGDEHKLALREQVDQQLQDAIARFQLDGAPLDDALAGLYEAIDECRYASVVYATCRRRGRYSSLDLYAAVEARASRGATAWLDPPIAAATSLLDGLLTSDKFQSVGDHVRRLGRDLREGQLAVVKDYAQRVGNEVKSLLVEDEVWDRCVQEWGRGSGFKARVSEHLRAWSRRQLELTAHQRTTTSERLPMLQGIVPSAAPPAFTLWVRNLRALHRVRWAPTAPVSLLVGANGTGKSTLLLTLRLMRLAYARGLPEAVAQVLRGSSNLASWGAGVDETVEIGLDLGSVSWRIELITREGTVEYLTNERLTEDGREVFTRDTLGAFVHGDQRLEPDSQIGLRTLMDRGARDPALRRVAAFLQGISVFHDPDLWSLREQGSSTTQDRHLSPRGINALTLLRRWHQERVHRDRYQFVVDGLRAAFPSIVDDLDFVEAGKTLVARVYRPGTDQPSPLADEANGVLQLLVLLCEVAGAPDQSVVAIDEPENSLHPYALRVFLRRASRWAQHHELTVLLATHSTVLLDEFDDRTDRVYVMKTSSPGESLPTSLDELCDPQWLEGFKLGDLYEQGEIGSNDDEV